MADIVTGTVTGQLDVSTLLMEDANIRREIARDAGDIRRDLGADTADIRRDLAKDTCDAIDAVKTSSWAVSDRVGTEADRVVAQDTAYFIATQKGLDDVRLNLSHLEGFQEASTERLNTAIQLAAAKTDGNVTLYGERGIGKTELAQAVLSHKIESDGAATRQLLNQLKMDELNRQLNERHTSLVECREHARHGHDAFTASQFAAMQTAIQNLNSQVNETRQGMVNFGTMLGVGQSSTSNNVR